MLLFISTIQLSIGMWNYHTLAYAVHETTRYVSTHGKGCTALGYTCEITVGTIASKVKTLLVGVPDGSVIVTLTTQSGAENDVQPSQYLLHQHHCLAARQQQRQQCGPPDHGFGKIPVPLRAAVLLAGIGNTSVRHHLAAGKLDKFDTFLRAMEMRSSTSQNRDAGHVHAGLRP